MLQEDLEQQTIQTSNTLYNDVVFKIKTSLTSVFKIDEIKSWVLGDADLNMCFVGDNCPQEYRKKVSEIIKEVESQYNN